jgi:hypothetical protein
LKNENISIYYYRTVDGTECDIVFSKSDKPIALAEIKYSSVPQVTRSLSVSIQDMKNGKNFIITPYSDEYQARNNITVCNLPDFLQKHLHKIK